MPSFNLFSGGTFLAASLLCAMSAGAQQAPSPLTNGQSGDASSPEGGALSEVTVTGNPLGASQTIAPASTLSGDQLLLEQSSTLGETLQRLPGVSSTYFGPNASRPVIRGLDGDRIRVLQNGAASYDASALSYDHNTPIDPLAVERIEVLRGPAALLYGGSALGGVVNVIDNRIPKTPVGGPEGGYTGRADAGFASGSREKSGAVLLEGGNDKYALHVDAFSRQSDDVAVPRSLPCTRSGDYSLSRRICNSANRAEGAAVGGTLFFDQGYIGASAAGYASRYGTVAEDDVHIGMRSTRVSMEGFTRLRGGVLESVKAQVSRSDYRHTEYEDQEPGTRFGLRGTDFRLEARHRAWGGLQGVWGLQWEDSSFDAMGEEAFVPPSRSRSLALFAHEEWGFDWGKLQFGARSEHVRVDTPGGDERFLAHSRSFHPGSAGVGVLVNVAPKWQLTGHLAYTQRAPKDYELFADGAHVATGTWERGDPSLGLEKATNLEAGAQWQDGPHRFAVTGFVSRFSNYIGLLNTGHSMGEGDEALPEFAYTGIRARFVGIEASGSVRLMGAQGLTRSANASVLDLDWRADMVRASNLTTGGALPRIAPARIGATLKWGQGPWGARLGFDYAAAQRRVPEGDRATGAYVLWNAALTFKHKLGRAQLQWYAKVDNLSNRLAYSATSVLTSTAFPKAPLPGRSIRIGVQAIF